MKTKDEVNYREAEQQQSCGGCTHFRGPDACSQVEGQIADMMLCDLWEGAEVDMPVDQFLFGGDL